MDKPTYTSLKELVGDTFTVEKAGGYTWKKWDNDAHRMLISDDYEEGFKKRYTLDTDKGRMDVSTSQLGAMLEITYKDGKADINGQTFSVRSNGKEGKEIRYFINWAPSEKQVEPSQADTIKEVKKVMKPDSEPTEEDVDRIDLDNIPF